MRFRSIAVTLVSLAVASTAQAQGATAAPQCTGPSGDACQQAVDLFHYLAPQLGTAIVGGNTTLGQGGTLGGPRFGLVPRFALGVRANLVMGNVPELQTPQVILPGDPSPPPARNFQSPSTLIPMPAVDLALGVFKGIPLALSNVGGVDLLFSASYVPEVSTDDVSITPDTPIQIGYGIRVGILQESLLMPGIGVSVMQRGLPKTTIVGTQGGATMSVNDLDLKTTAWRLTLSKSLLLFGLAAGVGQDMYKASTSITASTTTPLPAQTGPFTLKQDVTRTNMFADVSMNLFVVKLVGTVGRVSGGDIKTYNTFEAEPDKARTYASVGVRVGL